MYIEADQIVFIYFTFPTMLQIPLVSIITFIFGSWSGLVFLGRTAVLDISDVSGFAINAVGHGLDSSVGQQNVVFSAGGVSITAFVLSKVQSGIIVFDVVGIIVVGRAVFGLLVSGRRSISWCLVGSDQSNEYNEDNKSLKITRF